MYCLHALSATRSAAMTVVVTVRDVCECTGLRPHTTASAFDTTLLAARARGGAAGCRRRSPLFVAIFTHFYGRDTSREQPSLARAGTQRGGGGATTRPDRFSQETPPLTGTEAVRRARARGPPACRDVTCEVPRGRGRAPWRPLDRL